MAAVSNYLQNKIVDAWFRGGSYSFPSTLYVALCTATPSQSSTGSTITEVSGGNYARQSIAASTSNWCSTQGDSTSTSNGTSGQTSNSVNITWSGVTWSATVTAVAICDSATTGNMLFYAALSSNKTVSSGDTVQFAGSVGAGALVIEPLN